MPNFEEDFESSLATATVNRTRDFREGDTFVGNPSVRDAVFSSKHESRVVTHQRRIQAGLRALKRDPSRTTLLRRRLANAMKTRFRRLRQAIRELVVTDDALGLVLGTPVEMQVRQAWRFQTDSNKVISYRKWLQGQVDEKILTVGGVDGKPWTSDYVEHAYKKGMGRAYGDVTRLEAGIFEGTREQFLQDAFNAPEMLSKIELVSTRAFTQLRGVTDAMSQQMSRILADGLAAGKGPAAVARELTDNVTKLTNTRALVLARTEIIHAHAEGQLDGFERLGVKEVGIEAELSTAGDDLVCERCSAVESDGPYLVKKARGMIPVHPNCRCAWVPVTERKKKKDEVLEYRLPELPDTAEAKALLATEKTLRAETAALRKAYRAGDKSLRKQLLLSKEQLQAARTKIDDLARGVTPTPTPTPVTPVTPDVSKSLTKMNSAIDDMIRKAPPHEIPLECHQRVAELEKIFGDMLGKQKIEYYYFDELKGDVIEKAMRASPFKTKSQVIKNLIEDMNDGTVNGHSFIRVGNKGIDPYLRSLKVTQREIDKFDSYLAKIYDDVARVKKPPSVVPPPAPAGVSGTKFATAEDYRQYLLQQVEAAKTPVRERLINELIQKQKDAADFWMKMGGKHKFASPEGRSAARALDKINKELRNVRNVFKLDVEVQRQLLDEVSNKIGQCKLIAGKAETKALQEVHDSILRWIPGKRKVQYDFQYVDVQSVRRGQIELTASYSVRNRVIKMTTKGKQIYAHEFGHHVSYQLKDFMRAQTQFFKQRTIGDKLIDYGSFQGKKDKWKTLDVYAGRVYKDGRVPEVASIGIEHLWKNPAAFAKKDPEWFNMIVSQLKGIPTKAGAKLAPVGEAARVGRGVVGKVAKVKKVVPKKISKVSKAVDILTKKIEPLNQEMRNLTKELNKFVRKRDFGKGYQDVLNKQLGINKYVIKLREEIKALKVAEKAGALPLKKIPVIKPGKTLKIPTRPKVKQAPTFEKWLKDLKPFEKKALKRWTSEDYSYMARAYDDFLKGNTSKFNSRGWDYVKKMQAIENALDKSPGVKGQLWRGVWTEIDSPQYKSIMPAMKKGKVFQLPRITSFTSNEQIAIEYADWATVTPKKRHLKMTRIKFVLKKAPQRSASVDPFTISGGESEVLVGGGTKFRVIKIVRDKTAPDIKMEVFLEVVK